jgi:N4-(beta-N-acetylglucosaminyl)-L-asparaginase
LEFGIEANEVAWQILKKRTCFRCCWGGCKSSRADPKKTKRELWRTSDRDGRVTLDSCIMDEQANIGSVACLEYIKHPLL